VDNGQLGNKPLVPERVALPDSSRARRQKIKAILEFRQLMSPSVAGLTRIPKEKF
jgi:hypothetical protein